MKKLLINSADDVVTESLAGLAAAHPTLSVDVASKLITRAGGPTPGKVGLIFVLLSRTPADAAPVEGVDLGAPDLESARAR